MLKLRGIYDADEKYDVNDVALLDNGEAYRLRFPCPSGTPPVDTKYWARLSPELSACAQMIVSCMVKVETVQEPEPVKKTTRKKKEAAE